MSQIVGHKSLLHLGLNGGPNISTPEAGHPDMTGVRITDISDGSVFETIGLKAGDVIQDVNGIQTPTPDEMAGALASAFSDPDVPVRIEVERTASQSPAPDNAGNLEVTLLEGVQDKIVETIYVEIK